jgi:hypothetical protein
MGGAGRVGGAVQPSCGCAQRERAVWLGRGEKEPPTPSTVWDGNSKVRR